MVGHRLQQLAVHGVEAPLVDLEQPQRIGRQCLGHSPIAAAAHLGVLCNGLRSVSDEELRRRYDWIARTRPDAGREELERLVSLYHVSRQEVGGAPVCCDLETREHCGCDGWNMFDNATLEKAHEDLTGWPITIR